LFKVFIEAGRDALVSGGFVAQRHLWGDVAHERHQRGQPDAAVDQAGAEGVPQLVRASFGQRELEPRTRVINRACNSPLTNVITMLPLSDGDSMPTYGKANRRGATLSLIRPLMALIYTAMWYQN
jgi:hypothetical protein